MQKITIHDISKSLGIDSSTVSRALNNSNRVTPKTKEKVLAKAEELGYRRNILAANLRKQHSMIIGVVVPKISDNFFSNVISGIEEVASENGYHVFIAQSLEGLDREIKSLNNLVAYQVDGVLVSISMETKEGKHFSSLEKTKMPLVFFDRYLCGEENTTVSIDDEKAAYEATKHLISTGCRNIAHLAGKQNIKIYTDRLKGYQKALLEEGLKPSENYIITSPLTENDGFEKIQSISKEIDAIFSSNDHAAIGAMKYLKSIGKRIPEDISIIGFSNEPISEYTEPALSTIDQSSIEMGRKACKFLLDRIKNYETHKNKKLMLKSSLILRGSTK